MNNIFSYYTKYRDHIDEYNGWSKKQDAPDRQLAAVNSFSSDKNRLQKKAKAIAEPIMLLDSYTQGKAEDSETFYQTYNTELMSITGLLCALPVTIGKSLPFLNKHADKNTLVKKCASLVDKYTKASFNILGKNVKLSKIASIFSILGACIFFAKGVKNSIESQIGLTRKASFDGTKNITNNHKMFAILTPEQEEKLNSIVKHDENAQTAFVDKLKNKVDVRSAFQSVNDYNRTKKNYLKEKEKYFNGVNNVPDKTLPPEKIAQAKEDEQLFQNFLKNVEHDVMEPLERVETIANISYSALFAGGFLEYLLTDKLVDVLKVKNKPLRAVMKIGVPLITYLLLNKNISNFENKAILATKYKHLKQFTENPEQYTSKKEKKQNIFSFIKNTLKDMKEYDKFAETELPKIKEKLMAKEQISLTPEQEEEAKLLQKNTHMVVNTEKERKLENTTGIEVLSETVTNPVDVLGAAVGAKIGNTLAKNCSNKKLSGLMTFLGTIIGFVPVAIMEAKFTNEQKKSEKISTMLAMKDLSDYKKFADYSISNKSANLNIEQKKSEVFEGFIK